MGRKRRPAFKKLALRQKCLPPDSVLPDVFLEFHSKLQRVTLRSGGGELGWVLDVPSGICRALCSAAALTPRSSRKATDLHFSPLLFCLIVQTQRRAALKILKRRKHERRASLSPSSLCCSSAPMLCFMHLTCGGPHRPYHVLATHTHYAHTCSPHSCCCKALWDLMLNSMVFESLSNEEVRGVEVFPRDVCAANRAAEIL